MTGSRMQAEARLVVAGVHHQARTVWRSSRLFAALAVAFTVSMHACALLVAAAYHPGWIPTADPLATLPVVAGVWSALALLPALGGGESDEPTALAAVPAGRSFMLGTHVFAATVDLAPSLLVPMIVITSAAVGGWPGWVAGVALAGSAVLTGQAAGALAPKLVRRIGPLATLVAVSAGVLVAATALSRSGLGPAGWWLRALTDPVWLLPLLATWPVALAVAWKLAEIPERRQAVPRGIRMPKRAVPALTVTMLAGVARSLVGRNTVVTAALAPLLVAAGGVGLASGIGLFVAAATATIVGANGWAYDGGGTLLALARATRRQLLTARLAATAIWTALVALTASVTATLTGAPLTAHTFGQILVVSVAAATASIVPAVKRPATAELDSFRAQPAPLPSAMGTMVRAGALALAAVTLPLPAAMLLTAAYAALAVAHATWLSRDPVKLAQLQ